MIEAAQRIQLTRFAYVQPDLNGLFRPGGTGTILDALEVKLPLVLDAQIGVTS